MAVREKQARHVWYFAYGSNLNMSQMMTRVGEWETSRKAVLKGWRLSFNVDSRWGGKAANIIKTGSRNEKVWGAIYRISNVKLQVLTEYEGVEPQRVNVEAEDGEIEAETYVFNQEKAPDKPTEKYRDTLLKGLEQHGYEKEVIEVVRRMADEGR